MCKSDIDENYLKRCRELADKKHDFMAPTVHTSPAYRKLLTYTENLQNNETYLLARLKEAGERNDHLIKTNIAQNIINDKLKKNIPIELFDGHAVYENLPERVKFFIKASYVSDILDSVVALIRGRVNG